MKSPLRTCALALLLTAAACGGEDPIDLDSTLTIQNSSDFSFLEIYLSSVGDASWGRDLLGSTDILSPGETLEISGIECDDYDVRIVDEDQDECIVTEVDLCLNNEFWVVDNSELASCQGF